MAQINGCYFLSAVGLRTSRGTREVHSRKISLLKQKTLRNEHKAEVEKQQHIAEAKIEELMLQHVKIKTGSTKKKLRS